jgi:GntR family transcriptional regulator
MIQRDNTGGQLDLKNTDFTVNIDHRSGVPIYIQIVEQIRQQVASGFLHQGDQLPTVRLLATELRVNFNTVARAYRLLDEAGLISTQQGRGTYIWETPPPEVTARLRNESLEGITRHFLGEARRMGFTPAEAASVIETQMALWEAGEDLTDD